MKWDNQSFHIGPLKKIKINKLPKIFNTDLSSRHPFNYLAVHKGL